MDDDAVIVVDAAESFNLARTSEMDRSPWDSVCGSPLVCVRVCDGGLVLGRGGSSRVERDVVRLLVASLGVDND